MLRCEHSRPFKDVCKTFQAGQCADCRFGRHRSAVSAHCERAGLIRGRSHLAYVVADKSGKRPEPAETPLGRQRAADKRCYAVASLNEAFAAVSNAHHKQSISQ